MWKVNSRFHPFYCSSWSCSFNPNRTRNISLLLLWFVPAQQVPLPVPANHSQTKTRNPSLLPVNTVSARKGPLPGQFAQCRHRTVTRLHQHQLWLIFVCLTVFRTFRIIPIKYKTQGCPSFSRMYVRNAQGTLPGFWNGVDWRVLVKA